MKYIASTIVRASDIALNNNLFGGTLLRWLDEYGALFTYKYLHHKFVTYKMEKTYFLKSAKQGDCIDFYVTNIKFDKISVNFDLVARINNCKPAREIINTNMTFVAIDVEKEKPQYLNPFLFEQDEFEKWFKQKVINLMPNEDTIFHNQKHIEDMLHQLGMYKALMSSNDYKNLFAAICYHDIVHIPGDQENEIKSFNKMSFDLKRVLGEDEMSYFHDLIMCTKTNCDYDEIKKVKYGDLIHDLDMISFIDYETMKNNGVKIKSEYADFSTLDFYENKLKYFRKLIKTGVFISKQYVKFNPIAIDNIKKYMEEIKPLVSDLKKNVNEENENV